MKNYIWLSKYLFFLKKIYIWLYKSLMPSKWRFIYEYIKFLIFSGWRFIYDWPIRGLTSSPKGVKNLIFGGQRFNI